MKLRRFDYKIKETKTKPIIISSIVVLILLTGITIYATQARYKVTNTYNLLSGKVKEFFNSDISLEIKIIDESGNIITSEEFPPKKEYSYDSEKSYCENGSVIKFSRDEWMVTISTDKKDKCTLYFNKGVELATLIKEHAEENNYLYSTTPDFSKVTADGEYGLYQAADDYGISYYFRGDVENNYVQFGEYIKDYVVRIHDFNTSTTHNLTILAGTPMYWRIVRINGDGTIRLIYDGTDLVENGISHNASIGITAYNTSYDDPKYIGYTYDINGAQVDSTIKGIVESWYEKQFYETKYEEYISDKVFCNDQEVVSTSGNYKYYGSYYRIRTNKSPKLSCTQDYDKYTTTNNTIGNKLLKYPIGLITIDEVAMAGGVSYNDNTTFYLLDGGYYWTMSPRYFNYTNNTAIMWSVNYMGNLIDYYTANTGTVRPVININRETLFFGKGTIDEPYKLTS